jgi:hypothetical protein
MVSGIFGRVEVTARVFFRGVAISDHIFYGGAERAAVFA